MLSSDDDYTAYSKLNALFEDRTEYECKKISSANTTKVCLVQFFKQASKRYYISTIDNGIKFLCACFVIRDATPRILSREKRRSEDSRGEKFGLFFLHLKPKPK